MCKTIKQRVKFKADPAIVYDLLADSRKHTAFTGRQAIISKKIGGTFSIGESDVTGINVDLVPGRRIVQAWRHRRFPEGIFSMDGDRAPLREFVELKKRFRFDQSLEVKIRQQPATTISGELAKNIFVKYDE